MWQSLGVWASPVLVSGPGVRHVTLPGVLGSQVVKRQRKCHCRTPGNPARRRCSKPVGPMPAQSETWMQGLGTAPLDVHCSTLSVFRPDVAGASTAGLRH